MSFFSAIVTLFLVMDPLGNVPIFLSVLKQVRPERRNRVVIREVLIAYGVLLLFLFVGDQALQLLQIEQESISIAGGIVLFLIAIRMIFPRRGGESAESIEGEPLIVPLAIPLVAGPSALATLLLLQRAENSSTLTLWLATTTAWLATAVILIAAPFFYRILGKRGLAAMERLMGMVLVMIAVQMLLNGIRVFLKS